jgi:hypothetical protein
LGTGHELLILPFGEIDDVGRGKRKYRGLATRSARRPPKNQQTKDETD